LNHNHNVPSLHLQVVVYANMRPSLVYRQYKVLYLSKTILCLHRISKLCNLFLSELRQISTRFGNFWKIDDKETKMRDALKFHLN